MPSAAARMNEDGRRWNAAVMKQGYCQVAFAGICAQAARSFSGFPSKLHDLPADKIGDMGLGFVRARKRLYPIDSGFQADRKPVSQDARACLAENEHMIGASEKIRQGGSVPEAVMEEGGQDRTFECMESARIILSFQEGTCPGGTRNRFGVRDKIPADLRGQGR